MKSGTISEKSSFYFSLFHFPLLLLFLFFFVFFFFPNFKLLITSTLLNSIKWSCTFSRDNYKSTPKLNWITTPPRWASSGKTVYMKKNNPDSVRSHLRRGKISPAWFWWYKWFVFDKVKFTILQGPHSGETSHSGWMFHHT